MAGEKLYQAMLDTEKKFDGIDYEEVSIYIALNHTASSVPYNIRKCVPVAGNQWRFTRSPDTFTAEEKRLLFAEAVRLGVMALFGLHLYGFANKVFVQKSGTRTRSR